MSDLRAESFTDTPNEVSHHMLSTLTPGQLQGGVRETLDALALNFTTLLEELKEILEAASEFNCPETPIDFLVKAEGQLATGVRCLARSGGLIEQK